MREEQIRQLETQLATFDYKISELEGELENATPAVRNSHFRDLQEVKEKRDAAESRLAKLRLRQAQSWEEEDLQAGIVRVFDDIGTRVNRLVSRVSGTGQRH